MVNKLIIIYREYGKRIFVTLMLVLICAISFYMSDQMWSTYLKKELEIRYKYDAYNINPYDINKITFSVGSKYQEQKDMLEELSDIEGISAYGLMSGTNIQMDSTKELIDCIVSDAALIQMCNTGITSDIYVKAKEEWQGCELVWLGSSYKGKINIGDKCLINGIDAVIAGFLKDDARWLTNSSVSIGKYDLSSTALVFTDNYKRFDWGESLEFTTPVYYITDYKDNEIIKRSINEYQVEKGIRAGITNEGEELRKNIEDNAITDDKTFVASVLLYAIAIVAVSAVTIIECLINKRDYAVFIINGISRRAVYFMIVVKNALLICVPAVVVWVYRQWKIFHGIIPHNNEFASELSYMATKMSHCVYVPAMMLVQAVLMISISCLIPIIYLHKRNIADLMGK